MFYLTYRGTDLCEWNDKTKGNLRRFETKEEAERIKKEVYGCCSYNAHIIDEETSKEVWFEA